MIPMLLSLREVHCQIQRHQQKSKLLETPFFFTMGTVVKNIELYFMVFPQVSSQNVVQLTVVRV